MNIILLRGDGGYPDQRNRDSKRERQNGWKESGGEVCDTLQIATREGMFRTEVPTRDPRDRLEIKANLRRSGIKANFLARSLAPFPLVFHHFSLLTRRKLIYREAQTVIKLQARLRDFHINFIFADLT